MEKILDEDTYRGFPRGRVEAPYNIGGNVLIHYGEDFPANQYKRDIYSDFNLGVYDSLGKIKWVSDGHEKMDPVDRKHVEKILGIKYTPTGWVKSKVLVSR